MKEIINEIKDLSTMSGLGKERFTDEGGLADQIVIKLREEREGLKVTQLRKVFNELKSIQRRMKGEKKEFKRADIAPLIPIIAYARGREHITKDFYVLLKTCFSPEKLKTGPDFNRLVEFLEAIVAYHKFRSKE